MPSRRDSPPDFGGAVLLIVEAIPRGFVMTYGDVAAELGSLGARAVGRVMAHEGSSVPWWRVVRADGRPPAGHEAEALTHYRIEDTSLRWRGSEWRGSESRRSASEYRLDLTTARHRC